MSKKVSNELQAEVRRRRVLYLHILYVFIPSDCPLGAVRALNYCADQFLCRQTPAPQDTRTHTCKTDERRRHFTKELDGEKSWVVFVTFYVFIHIN